MADPQMTPEIQQFILDSQKEGYSDDEITSFIKQKRGLPADTFVGPPEPRWTDRHPTVAKAARAAVDTLPAVGSMVGGVLAAPAAIVVTVSRRAPASWSPRFAMSIGVR